MNYFSSFTLSYVELLLSDDVATHPLQFSRERTNKKKKKIEKKGLSFEMNKDEGYVTSLYETIKCPEYSFRKLRPHRMELNLVPLMRDSFAKNALCFVINLFSLDLLSLGLSRKISFCIILQLLMISW